MRRKILIISGVAAIIILVVVIFVVSRGDGDTSPIPSQGGQDLPGARVLSDNNTGPSVGMGGAALRKVSENKAFDLWVSANGDDVYYIGLDGKVFLGKNGPDLEISDSKLSALNSVEQSPSSTKILAAFGNPRSPQWAVFGLSDKFWSPLPGSITKATWGNNDNQIFALASNNSVHELDLSRSPYGDKNLFQGPGFKDFDLMLSPKSNLLLVEKPSALTDSRVFEINLKDRSLALVFSNQRGVVWRVSEDRKWSFVFSSPESFFVLDQLGNALLPPETDTGTLIPKTIPDKCGSYRENIFCFVPINFGSAQLPDDYLTGKIFTEDDLYEINAVERSAILKVAAYQYSFGPIDAKNVVVRDNIVYFINRYDDALYELILK